MNRKKQILIIATIFVTLSIYASLIRVNLHNTYLDYEYEKHQVYTLRNLELTKENFFLVCEHYDVHHSTIVYAQAILETGHFKSNVFKTKNNCLGLWDSRNHKFYEFEHWTDCIKGYRDMVQYKYNGGDYYSFLDNIRYASAEHYTETVRKIEKQLKKQK